MLKALYSLAMAVLWILLPEAYSRLDILDSNLNQSGNYVLLYILLKVISAFGLFICIVNFGILVIALIKREDQYQSPLTKLIYSFGLGASVFSLLFIVIGLCGGLYTSISLAVTTPLILIAPYTIFPLIKKCFNELYSQNTNHYSSLDSVLVKILLIINLFFLFSVLIQRAIFPSEIDGDVWEHYLHYFASVINSHHIWPNDVWEHFYISKFALLQINAILLGDILSSQLVSWCFILFIGIISYDVVRKITKQKIWALLAPIFIFQISCILRAIPNFQKHHIVIAGMTMFVGWCVMTISNQDRVKNSPILLGGIVASFYLSLYMPVMSIAIFLGTLMPFTINLVQFKTHRFSNGNLWIGLSAILGCMIVLAFNYYVTGMALDAPIKFFSEHSDTIKFSRIWDPLVYKYWFLGIGAVEGGDIGMKSFFIPNFSWMFEVMRAEYLRHFVSLLGLLIITTIITLLYKRFYKNQAINFYKINFFLLTSFCLFYIGTLITANVFPGSGSIYRLYAFISYALITCLICLLLFTVNNLFFKKRNRSLTILIISLVASYSLW